MRAILIWSALVFVVTVPIAIAATSPLLAWRQPVYIAAGFAGIAAMVLLVIQPLLAGGYLPGLAARRGRGVHRAVGVLLVGAVLVHVAALWITSPPDVVDALLFSAPTWFSVWGVIAMWAVFAAAWLAILRRKMRPRTWRIGHTALVTVVVITSIAHALLIDGTMGTISKIALCAFALGATAKVIVDLRVMRLAPRLRP